MKQIGVCSVLIACCLTAPAWAVRFGEEEPADGIAPVPADGIAPVALPDGQIQVVPEQAYMPWQVYGYGSPYDRSAIAGYNAWPQVCSDGLWDNFCNEHHCWCYKGPKDHYRQCGHHMGGCNSCGTCGGHGGHGIGKGRYQENFVPVNSVRGNCANGNCAPFADTPLLEMPAVPEPALQPQAIPEPPTEEQSSARLLPRNNPIRQPLMPTNWRSVK